MFHSFTNPEAEKETSNTHADMYGGEEDIPMAPMSPFSVQACPSMLPTHYPPFFSPQHQGFAPSFFPHLPSPQTPVSPAFMQGSFLYSPQPQVVPPQPRVTVIPVCGHDGTTYYHRVLVPEQNPMQMFAQSQAAAYHQLQYHMEAERLRQQHGSPVSDAEANAASDPEPATDDPENSAETTTTAAAAETKAAAETTTTTTTTATSTHLCLICKQRDARIFRCLGMCEYKLCLTCMEAWLRGEIESGRTTIMCPASDCGAMMDTSTYAFTFPKLHTLLLEKTFERNEESPRPQFHEAFTHSAHSIQRCC